MRNKTRQSSLWKKYENNLLNQGISDIRITKLSLMFRTCERGIKKDFNKCIREDVERFVNKLNRDEFKKRKGQKYSGSTKADIKKFLRQFFKWLKGNDEFYPKEVSWIKTKIRKDEKPEEKPILTYKEVMQFANTFKKIEYRILVLMLFDSGFRIQEMLSAKKKDLTWEEYDGAKKCFWINCNQSKTVTRKVPVPLFTEDIQSYYNSTSFKIKGDDDPLFEMQYKVVSNNLIRVSEKLYGDKKRITAHCLRHSSATYYAREYDGNMNMIAERYGWSYSSEELKTYIRKSGAYQRAGAKKVFTNQAMKLKEENEELKGRLDDMESRMKKVTELLVQMGVDSVKKK